MKITAFKHKRKKDKTKRIQILENECDKFIVFKHRKQLIKINRTLLN